ncbi:MAG TPA: acetolactate synthase [Solirubrobacterales bacterium]|nr:acetolactate synthase [Solirubrobacterales bacterium]
MSEAGEATVADGQGDAQQGAAPQGAARQGADAAATEQPVHGGKIVARAMASRGVSHLFTLSGGHIFSIYDGCKEQGIEIVDVRHEQAAVFAAEGFAKATRRLGVAALTAGPGVTNGVSAIAGAQANGSPVTVLGGRAPEMRWGSGSLQEMDHLPFVSPLVKSAETVKEAGRIGQVTAEALDRAAAAPTGPTFVDYPMDVVFMEGEPGIPPPPTGADGDAAPGGVAPDGGSPAAGVEEAAQLLAGAERPVIMAGTGLYWGRAEHELQRLAEVLGIPVFLNGMGRGCLAADHPLAFSRARGAGLGGADVALVIGVPMDFRLGFGAAFGEETEIIRLDCEPNRLTANRPPRLDLVGDIRASLAAIAESAGAGGDGSDAAGGRRTAAWVETLRETENERRAAEQQELSDERSPLHPVRVYGELDQVLDRNAIVVGDGGDFVSYAGKFINTYEAGCWMDPGPFGCLGAGPGQAIGAKLAHPDRQVCLLLGDGAFGFSGIEFDTMARHGLGVVGVMGNNGIWALEHHPMKFLYGYSVAAELRPETPYHRMVESLGCDGIEVRDPAELRPALERAFSSGRPTLVNVITDPEVVYPRKANLA